MAFALFITRKNCIRYTAASRQSKDIACGFTASSLHEARLLTKPEAMAKSLLCKDCGSLFRNVAEAQAHNEVTGHANFEESTEAVRPALSTLITFRLSLESAASCRSAESLHLLPALRTPRSS